MPGVAAELYCFEGFVLDLRWGVLRGDAGENIELRRRSFDVLRYLIENPGRLVSKDELMKAIWPDVIVGDGSLTQCIHDVRKALGDRDHRIIATIPGRGYALQAPVTPALADEASLAPAPSAFRQAKEAVKLCTKAQGTVPACVPITCLRPPSVIVLPFANLSDDPHHKYLAEALTDEVTADLARIPGISVISPDAVAGYGGPVDVRQIGNELGVRYFVRGSVRASSNTIRIVVRMGEAASGECLWADRMESEFADVLEVQDEIAMRIATAVNVKLSEAELRRAGAERPNNPNAHDLLLRGQRFIVSPDFRSAPKTAQARSLFEQALQIDSRLAAARAGLAWTHAVDVLSRWSQVPAEQLSQAEEAMAKALEIDSTSCLVHFCRAEVLFAQSKLEDALVEFERTLAMNRNYAVAYGNMGIVKAFLGRPEEGLRDVRKVIDLNRPGGGCLAWLNIGTIWFMLDNIEKAVDCVRRSTELDPDLGVNQVMAASVLAIAGNDREAHAAVVKAKKRHPTLTINKIRAAPYSTNRAYLAWRERMYEGLRIAGMPED